MRTFIIYQNDISKLNDQINAAGSWDQAADLYPEVRAHLECSCHGSARFTKEMFRHYAPVATIEADSLEEVFEVGNIGPEESIIRLARMHSVSVGDIIETPVGALYMVEDIGFRLIADRIGDRRESFLNLTAIRRRSGGQAPTLQDAINVAALVRDPAHGIHAQAIKSPAGYQVRIIENNPLEWIQ